MSWLNLWDGLKTKTCRYLLKEYLGQYFENNLNLEQLKVDLYNGKAVVENIYLKVNEFNKIFEDQGWAFEVVSGHIGCLTVVVPWNALMTNDSSLEISNLTITLKPVIRKQNGATMLESMWSSVSSSMQMAEECMKQADDDVPFLIHNNSIVGLEKFAETIDNVLSRIHAKLIDTTVNIEYELPHCSRKLVLSLKSDHVEYKNTTGYDKCSMSTSANEESDNHSNAAAMEQGDQFNPLPMIAKHNLILNGLTLYTSEINCFDDHTTTTTTTTRREREMNLCKIVEFKGVQNIQIKTKQTENIVGPKVNLEIIVDEIFFLLTPRQIHLLIEITNGFNKESPKENMHRKRRSVNHTIQKETYNSKMTGIISKTGEWCTETENYDLPEFSSKIRPTRSIISNRTDCGVSIITSASTNSMTTSCTNTQREIVHTNTSGEILKFKIQIALISGITLHDDVLVPTVDVNNDYEQCSLLTAESINNFAQIANEFYSNVKKETQSMVGFHLPITNKNYLYLNVSPILISGNQQRHYHDLSLKTTLSATMCDLCEILDGTVEHLLLFDRKGNCVDGYHIRPEINITHTSLFSTKLNSNASNNKMECTLDKCSIDFDISIYDRLSALFAVSPFSESKSSIEQNDSTSQGFELNIKSDLLIVNLRFPMVDGRSPQDPNKIPWWRKNVRKDFLTFHFQNFSIRWKDNIHIIANEINTYYCDGTTPNDIHVLNCVCLKDSTQNTGNRKEISILIKFIGSSGNNYFGKDTRTPFSSKCTYGYTSNVEGLQHESEHNDTFLPGDTEELHEFCEHTMKNSQLQIAISIPVVKIVLESKQLYEIIYNRLNCDLFMWEPRAPLHEQSAQDKYKSENCMNNSVYSPYFGDDHHRFVNDDVLNFPLKSSIMEQSIYCSVDSNIFPKAIPSVKPNPIFHACSFEIQIGEGELYLYAQVRDAENRVRPFQSGKFHCLFNDLKLFSVNGFNNDNNLGYFCLQLNTVNVFHCGLISEDSPGAWSGVIDVNMAPTIHNISPNCNLSKSRKEVLSMVAEIKKQSKQRLKRIKMSFGISGAVLRHNPALASQTWLNQLIDFMDVLDFPIEEYEPFALVSEIQVHVWNSGIDYRPKYFPYRSFIDIGSCTLSTNVISSITGCTLRLIAEDCILNIGTMDLKGLEKEDSATIAVLEVGLFNISLRLNEENNTLYSKVDFRCSIHDVHLRTCYDSAAALAQLIAYIASDKDLIMHNDDNINDNDDDDKFSDVSNVILTHRDEDDQNYLDYTQEHVNKLMAEALKDVEIAPKSSQIAKSNKFPDKKSYEVFYFPDEPDDKSKETENKSNDRHHHHHPNQHYHQNTEVCSIMDFESSVMLQSYYNRTEQQQQQQQGSLSQVQLDLGDLSIESKQLHEEKDFCVIHDEEIAFMDKFGIKEIDVSEDPLRIVDNHFCLPHEKVDLLRAPANFPLADQSYTLCEMTFTWHIYGGRDFPEKNLKSNSTEENERFTTGMSDAYKHGVSQGHSGEPEKKPKKIISHGAGRNLEVLVEIQFTKIRFSFETYPTNTMYSSRQVLLVSEIEIRDRLRSSDINKLLYRPNQRNMNPKSDENMVIVKALHIRPDPKKSLAEECSLRVSILPIKVNIDQDTLLFLEEFFSSLAKNSQTEDSSNADGTTTTTTTHATTIETNNPPPELDIPVLGVNEIPEAIQDFKMQKIVEKNLNILIDQETVHPSSDIDGNSSNSSPPIYFREVIFSPAMPITLDYQGRRIELSRGPIAGLLMGLAQLQGSGICLREIINRRGLLGWNKLFTYLCKEWLKDIKRNQLPNILSGIGPTNAVLQLFQGVYDLFWLPIEQYNKDGRIIRGFQLGAQSFSARTALAALEITSRIIHLLQFTAETTFDMLSAGPSVRRKRKSKQGKKRHGRPKDLREGVANAYTIVKEGINDSANTLIEAAITEHDQKGYTGAVGAVVRQIPQLVVCPAVLATQATTNILGGAKSSLVPEAKLEARDKWKHESN